MTGEHAPNTNMASLNRDQIQQSVAILHTEGREAYDQYRRSLITGSIALEASTLLQISPNDVPLPSMASHLSDEFSPRLQRPEHHSYFV